MPLKAQQYTFVGRKAPDTIIGERVIVRLPLDRPVTGEFQNLTLHELVKHVEAQYIELMRKHGRDCDHFEVTVDAQGKIGVIFTRPMDRLELTQIRAHRERTSQGRDQIRLSDDELLSRNLPRPAPRSLPDPSVAALSQSAH